MIVPQSQEIKPGREEMAAPASALGVSRIDGPSGKGSRLAKRAGGSEATGDAKNRQTQRLYQINTKVRIIKSISITNQLY